jgi:hypothetical protein
MQSSRTRVVLVLDVVVVVAALVAASIVPVFFMVPFNDEWLRLNYLANHTVWEWTVMHAQTWVVRPTAELILGYASLPNTRRALGEHFSASAFLERFQLIYVLVAIPFWIILYVNAAILAGRFRALPHTCVLFAFTIICLLVSDELGFAFYWADGYANILIPFVLLTTGMALMIKPNTLALSLGAVLVVVAALGHEVMCCYGLGFTLLSLVLRKPSLRPWLHRGILLALLVLCSAILWEQLFGAGPTARSDFYFQTTGIRYDFASVLLNIKQIVPLRVVVICLAVFFIIGAYRDRLSYLPQRAVADLRRNRLFWSLLLVGTLLTCFLPLASVGLKKARLAVSYYSVLTYLFFILLAVLLYPLVDGVMARTLRGYRQHIASLLPALIAVALVSPNIGQYRAALQDFSELRGQARAYMETLFTGKGKVTLCRPLHPFTKPGRRMTARNEAEYFGLESVRYVCPRGSQ